MAAMTTDSNNAATGQVVSAAARVYEEFFVPALFGAWAEPVADVAGLRPGQRVLDVGCGTGVHARAAARRVGPTGRVVGLDANEGMLAVAAGSAEPVQWRRGTAEALPFSDASFDRVVSGFVLMFLTDRTRALAEMARVLTPGGRLTVTTWTSLPTTPGYAAMVDLLAETVGPSAATALSAPFSLGDSGQLHELLAPAFDHVTVRRIEGTARFPSIDAWVHTDIRGWTLADTLTEHQYETLLIAARDRLARFTRRDGTVSFPAPALIATATRARQSSRLC
jgi:ubiquinone/menaquinone biosynthesis C-methylase UbiE